MARPKGTVTFETKFMEVAVRPVEDDLHFPRRVARIYYRPKGNPLARYIEVTPDNTDELILEALGEKILGQI